ncbi:zinc finger protein 271-like isoform X2 [Rhinatrema bivittatum]|nr:zinc finger protein 271-like isoform X2 [Rhinatrema bivittatum]
MPVCCSSCKEHNAVLRRPKTGHSLCKECFFLAFEEEVHQTIVSAQLFQHGETVGIGASGGKDSTVLAHVLKVLNERHGYGLTLFLLSVDEGITGYRDDSLETVRRNQQQYELPLKIVSYEELYGWTMDDIVRQVGLKNNCTFCGVFRRQALDRGALMLGVDKICTGHNADDIAETVLMNVLRGDIARLRRCTAVATGSEGAIPRCKPLKYAYEKEIVLYAYFKKLDYFSTECVYSPNAYRGHARAFLKDLEALRPSAVLDIIHSDNEKRKENREEHSTVLALTPRQSRNADENLSQRTEGGGTSQSQQDLKQKQWHPAGDSLDGVIVCERSDREVIDISEHQRHLRAERPFQSNNSDQMTSDLLQGHQRAERPFQSNNNNQMTSDLQQSEEKWKKSFPCHTCGRTFDRKCHFVLHQKTHRGVRPFPCSQCGKSFKQKVTLQLHQRIHTQGNTFTCTECKKHFSSSESLVRHQRTHRVHRPFHCPQDGESYSSEFSLLNHPKMETEEGPLSSPESGENIIQKQDLINRKPQKEKPLFICTDGNKNFYQKENFKRQLKFQQGEKANLSNECNKILLCEKVFSGDGKKYTDERPLSCIQAEKSFSRKAKVSQQKKFPKVESQFIHTECDQRFGNEHNLIIHQRDHTGVKPFTCGECGKRFSQNRKLSIHQTIHTGVKQFQCSQCDKRFRQKGDLKLHQRIHTEEKPFTCSECGKSLSRKTYLMWHQRIHTGVKQSPCTLCGKSFRTKKELASHQKNHIGVKCNSQTLL